MQTLILRNGKQVALSEDEWHILDLALRVALLQQQRNNCTETGPPVNALLDKLSAL